MNNPFPERVPRVGYKEMGLPHGAVVHRLDQFRTKRKWWQFWRPKYERKIYALTDDAMYDVTDVLAE